MSRLAVRDLGRLDYNEAFQVQRQLVEQRKRNEIPDQLLFVEHPHVITMGRNGRQENLLAPIDELVRSGISYEETNRGGDVTYHGPGQIVGYPILDLRNWKRDVVAYVRAVEQCLIDVLAQYGLAAYPEPGMTGVWVKGAKIAAIGVHISRWVTSHGFALNHRTDLRYFQYIIPCGLTKPVTSMQALGCDAAPEEVKAALAGAFAARFGAGPAEIIEKSELALSTRGN